MSVRFSSWILRGAKRTLAALAVLVVLSQATPSAFAAVSLSFKASDVGTAGTTGPTALTSGVSNAFTLDNFDSSVTATSLDIPGVSGSSRLSTTTITLNNTSSTTDTLVLSVTGTGFSAGTPGQSLFVNFSISGTGGPTDTATDTTTGRAWADNTNAAFGTGFTITPDVTIVPTSSNPLSATYTSGSSSTLLFTLSAAGPPFSLSQALAITLGGGNSAQLTIITRALTQLPNTVPEPSTMALAGLGALGLIGYGLRRHKVLGA
jgi:hypothetical protein